MKEIVDHHLFVATNGNDHNPGTFDQPFRTIIGAKSKVRRLLPQTVGTINVWIRGGTYYLEETIIFTPEDSGSRNFSVNYSAYQNERVIMSGGQEITSKWRHEIDGIMVVDIESGLNIDQLFLNGTRQVLARYPNYNPTEPILDGYQANAIAPSRIAKWKHPTTGFVRGLHDREWGGNSFKITGVQSDGHVSLEWAGDNNRGSGLHEQYRLVENIFEELDVEGEWFYNKQSGTLYFKPPPDMDLNEEKVEVASLEELIKIEGDHTQTVAYLNFSNLIFTHTHRTLFTRAYEPILRSDWRVARAGTIFMENAENITVKNSTFDQVGGNAIFVSGYNRNHVITNNEFNGSGASDIQVVGLQSAVRYPSTWEEHKVDIQDEKPGPKTREFPKGVIIGNNHMYNMGVFEKQSSGVNIAISENILVRSNTIHQGPRAGINIGTGVWGGHVIEFNDIFDMTLETDDHGPINAWGRSRFWSYKGFDTNGKLGSVKKPYVKIDATQTVIIRNNRIKHKGDWGIDLDDGASNYEIYNNLLLNTGIKLREGFFRHVYNNIIKNGAIHFHVGYEGNDDIIRKNILVTHEPYKFIADDPVAGNRKHDKNLFWNNDNDIVGIDRKSWQEKGFDQRSIIANPMFLNPNRLDYRVQEHSPALTLGFKNFPMEVFGKSDAPIPTWPDKKLEENIMSVRQELMGAEIVDIVTDGQRSALGLPDKSGVYFSKIPDQTYAKTQGFILNDVIRALNNIQVIDHETFWEVYSTLEPGSCVTAKIFRNQQEEGITFQKEYDTDV